MAGIDLVGWIRSLFQSKPPGNEFNPGNHAKEARARAASARKLQCPEIMIGVDTYRGETVDGVPHGLGVLVNSGETRIWEGDFREEVPHGWAIVQRQNGERYEGQWEYGKPSGQGIFFYPNGARYEGEFRGGEYHGRGSESYSDGSSYEGEHRQGERHGTGKYCFENGNWHLGAYEHGNLVSGTAFLSDLNCFYEGEFARDEDDIAVPHGRGRMDYPNGDWYDGEWKFEYRHGQGKMRLGPESTNALTESIYDGEWVNDKIEGFGKQVIMDEFGSPEIRYEGYWRDGKKHGTGKLVMIQSGKEYPEHEFRDGFPIR